MADGNRMAEEDVARAGATGICAGANLRTPCGARHVEFLRPGDLVVTRDNGLQPVRMIWTQTFTAAEIAADPSLAPVVLLSRAIGPMMPKQKLAVGGAHRLLIPGWRLADEADTENCLVPARDVDGLGGSECARVECDVTYYNVVFEASQVFSANGLPVESFTPSAEAIRHLPRSVRELLEKTFPDLDSKFTDYPAPAYRLRERVSYTPDFA